MVRAVAWKICELGFAAVAFGEARRLRRESKLEADVRELRRVLPLSWRASDAVQSIALRLSGERSRGRTVSRGIHEDQRGKEPDDERRGLRDGDLAPPQRW